MLCTLQACPSLEDTCYVGNSNQLSWHKPAISLHPKVVKPKDKTPLENKCGTMHHITFDNDPTQKYIGESKRPRFKQRLNLDKPTGVGEHCLPTGHSVSKNNIRVAENRKCTDVSQGGHSHHTASPTMNRDQGYQVPPSTPTSVHRYMGFSHRQPITEYLNGFCKCKLSIIYWLFELKT